MMNRALAPEPMRRAFVSRFSEVVNRLAEMVDPATLTEVLSMADALSGLSVALERATVMEAAVRDPLAPARARGIAGREHLIEDAGGVLRLSEAADRLDVTPQAITGRRNRGTILAVPMPNGEWVYPACQFAEAGLVPGLGSFLREFKDIAPWTQLAVLLASSARHGGRSALELLTAGEIDAARSIAATYGQEG